MYGAESTSLGGGAALAVTGLSTGAVALAACGIIFAGIALIMIFRKNGRNKP